MKKIILAGWFCLMAFFFGAAQPAGTTEKFEVKVGNELTPDFINRTPKITQTVLELISAHQFYPKASILSL
jgi:hypothetical protein